MEIRINPASLEEKSILRHLLELYAYDFSEFSGEDVDNHGLYGYNYLDNYWTETGRYPFLVRINDKLAGFALIRTIIENGSTPYYSMAEFFIMKKYRKCGAGRSAAIQIFDLFRGSWQIAEWEDNKPAQAFWRKVVSEYTNGNFDESYRDDDAWHGPIQCFQNTDG